MKCLRIEKHIVDAPVDGIHSLQSVDGSQINTVVVTDDEITALDQFDAHRPREVAVFEIGAVVDARR